MFKLTVQTFNKTKCRICRKFKKPKIRQKNGVIIIFWLNLHAYYIVDMSAYFLKLKTVSN